MARSSCLVWSEDERDQGQIATTTLSPILEVHTQPQLQSYS